MPTEERATDGWDREALDRAVAAARAASSTDVVVLHHGRAVVDEAWEPDPSAGVVAGRTADGRVRQDVASTQKSLTSVLVGLAVGRGLVTLDDPVSAHLGSGWAGPAAPPSESRITLRHLLTMTSGLADDLRFVAEPGEVWDYNLGPAYHTVKRVLSAAAGATLDDLTTAWLSGPLGLVDTTWEPRVWVDGTPELFRPAFQYPDGEPIEALTTTARDLAAFGQAVLAGALPLDPGYASAMGRPSQALNPAYGLLWWVNGQPWSLAPKSPVRLEGPFLPGVPDDAFAALGALDRLCVVVPSLGLVIVRAGAQAGERSAAGSSFVRSFTAAVCAAAPVS